MSLCLMRAGKLVAAAFLALVLTSGAALGANAITPVGNRLIDIDADRVPLRDLLAELETLASIEKVLLDPAAAQKPITISVARVTVTDGLREILKESGLDFVLWGGGASDQPLRLYVGQNEGGATALGPRTSGPLYRASIATSEEIEERIESETEAFPVPGARRRGPGRTPGMQQRGRPTGAPAMAGAWGATPVPGNNDTGPHISGPNETTGPQAAVGQGDGGSATDSHSANEPAQSRSQRRASTEDARGEAGGGANGKGNPQSGQRGGASSQGGSSPPPILGGLDTVVTDDYTMVGESVTYHDPDFVPYKNTEEARKARESVDVGAIP